MMKRYLKSWIAAAIALIALLSCTFFFVKYKTSHRQVTHQQIVQELGDAREKSGEMTKNDYVKLASVQAGIALSRTISDRDLDWVINLLYAKSIQDTEANRSVKASSVMLNLTGLRTLSAPQQQKLYQALLPYLTEPTTEESHSLKLMSISLLGHARVALAKPTLTQLAGDADEEVSQRAKSALENMSSTKH